MECPCAEASAVREEMVQAERRLRDEYTEALQGEAEMRERGDVAAAEGRAGLTGSIEEDRAVLSEALTKLEQDLAAETEARKEADDAAAATAAAATAEVAGTAEAAAADAATREEALRTEVFAAVDELDARAAANLENESKARREALDAAANALETVTAASAEAVVELAGEIDEKINATKEEVLQLIAGEAEDRERAVAAVKQAVDAEAAERKEADEGLDQNLVQSLAHEMEERTTAVEAARSELGGGGARAQYLVRPIWTERHPASNALKNIASRSWFEIQYTYCMPFKNMVSTSGPLQIFYVYLFLLFGSLRPGADIKSESETLRADLAQHAEEAAGSAAAAAVAAAAAGASVAAEVRGNDGYNTLNSYSYSYSYSTRELLERHPGFKQLPNN